MTAREERMEFTAVIIPALALAALLALGYWLLRGWINRRKATILDLGDPVGDMFQQIEDKYRPPCKEESVCRIEVAKARGELAAFLFPRIYAGLRGFERELEAAGFEVEFDFDLDFVPEMTLTFDKESFSRLHEKVECAGTADCLAANKAFVKKIMEDWLGDGSYHSSFDRELTDCSIYRISYFVGGIGGKARQLLEEPFFEGNSALTKKYVGLKEDLIAAQIKSEKKREEYSRSLPGRTEIMLVKLERLLRLR